MVPFTNISFPLVGMYDEEYRTEDEVGYYPDFIDGNYCRKYGEEHDDVYTALAGWKLHLTLSDCCWENFQVSRPYGQCMGPLTPEPML